MKKFLNMPIFYWKKFNPQVMKGIFRQPEAIILCRRIMAVLSILPLDKINGISENEKSS